MVIVVASKRPRPSHSDKVMEKRNCGTSSRRHVTPRPPPAGFTSTPSAPTRPVCVSGVVTTRLLPCSAYIPFIPPPPQGTRVPHLSPCLPPVRDRDRCTRPADGRQVHGQMASARSVPDWPRSAINRRIDLILIRAFFFFFFFWVGKEGGVDLLQPRKSRIRWRDRVNFYAVGRLIEFGSKTFTSFTKVSRAA